jgi:hypothetical protein
LVEAPSKDLEQIPEDLEVRLKDLLLTSLENVFECRVSLNRLVQRLELTIYFSKPELPFRLISSHRSIR